MPNSNHRFWSDQEHTKAQRELLQAREIASSEQLYYPNLMTQINKTFVQFYSIPLINIKNPFKLHISISPQDYGLVLYQSDLNKLVQEALSSHALISYKYVDPNGLRKIKENGKFALKCLPKFYQSIARHKALDDNHLSEKKVIYQSIKPWHDWFTQSWGTSFTPLNLLLEATPEQLQKYQVEGFALWKEVDDINARLEHEVQFTLYLPVGANTEVLMSLTKKITKYLTKSGIKPVPCPESDLPLTPFVSFRQDSYEIGGPYVPAWTKESLRLKEFARQSEPYKQLVQALLTSRKSEDELEFDETTAMQM